MVFQGERKGDQSVPTRGVHKKIDCQLTATEVGWEGDNKNIKEPMGRLGKFNRDITKIL